MACFAIWSVIFGHVNVSLLLQQRLQVTQGLPAVGGVGLLVCVSLGAALSLPKPGHGGKSTPSVHADATCTYMTGSERFGAAGGVRVVTWPVKTIHQLWV